MWLCSSAETRTAKKSSSIWAPNFILGPLYALIYLESMAFGIYTLFLAASRFSHIPKHVDKAICDSHCRQPFVDIFRLAALHGNTRVKLQIQINIKYITKTRTIYNLFYINCFILQFLKEIV